MIMAYVKDHDAQNMDIVLVGKDINADAARKILTANYVRHNFTDQIAAFARELQ